VPLNSNQVKSLQAGVHASGGGRNLAVGESGGALTLIPRFDVAPRLWPGLRDAAHPAQ
jgi:hypothetical protein